MRNRLRFVAVLWAACVGAALCTASLAADVPADQQMSKAIAKPLKAANDALQMKNYDAAFASIKEAQAVPGDKTPYETFVINAMLGPIYVQRQDLASAAKSFEVTAQSQYSTPEQKKAYLGVLAKIYYSLKDYVRAVDFGQQAVKAGSTDSDIYTLIAQGLYLQGKYKEAAAGMQDIISRQDKPDEKSLKFLWDCYNKINDDVNAGKVIEKLVTYYPKPDYWLNALAPLLRMDVKDEHLQLNIYRLMADVGVLKRPADYTDMAQLSMDQGYPGETQSTLEQAFAKNIYTEQRDKERNQRLLDGAKKRAADDLAGLAQSEKDAASKPTGDVYVQLGAAYLSYGQNEKAVAAISKGIAKGGLKYPEEANLLLGVAQLRTHNPADAQKSFEKVASSSNMGYARLGRLWLLHAKG